MKEKVYEPDEDYKELAETLLKMIEQREQYAANIKLAAPESIAEVRQLLAEMDKHIEEFEASLADSYEKHLEFCRANERLGEMNELLGNNLEMMFIFTKHVLPDKFQVFAEKILSEMSPANAEEFLDRIAVRETNELDQIITKMTGNKQWRKALENLS